MATNFHGLAVVVTMDEVRALPSLDRHRLGGRVLLVEADTVTRAERSWLYRQGFTPWYQYVALAPRAAGMSRWSRQLRYAIVAARDGSHCWYCGATDAVLTLDHVIPRSRSDLIGNGPGQIPSDRVSHWDNLRLACDPCNGDKDNRTPEEWRAGVISRRRHAKTEEEKLAYDRRHIPHDQGECHG